MEEISCITQSIKIYYNEIWNFNDTFDLFSKSTTS